jgi:hypothetical protein
MSCISNLLEKKEITQSFKALKNLLEGINDCIDYNLITQILLIFYSYE